MNVKNSHRLIAIGVVLQTVIALIACPSPSGGTPTTHVDKAGEISSNHGHSVTLTAADADLDRFREHFGSHPYGDVPVTQMHSRGHRIADTGFR